jgi:hypothetical protein
LRIENPLNKNDLAFVPLLHCSPTNEWLFKFRLLPRCGNLRKVEMLIRRLWRSTMAEKDHSWKSYKWTNFWVSTAHILLCLAGKIQNLTTHKRHGHKIVVQIWTRSLLPFSWNASPQKLSCLFHSKRFWEFCVLWKWSCQNSFHKFID